MSERIQDLRALLEEEPDDALLRLTLGKEYLEGGDAEAALPHLERVVAVDPRYTVAYRYLGTALERLERTADAADVWERGIAVAEETGDLQAGKEMRVFLDRLRARGA
jgi:Tfp pilus assembly protein PilF